MVLLKSTGLYIPTFKLTDQDRHKGHYTCKVIMKILRQHDRPHINVPKPTKKPGLIKKWKEQDNVIVKEGGWQANDYMSDGYDGIPLEDRKPTGEIEGDNGEQNGEATAAYPSTGNDGNASQVDETRGELASATLNEVQVGMPGIDSRKRKRRESGGTRTSRGLKMEIDTSIDYESSHGGVHGVRKMTELEGSSDEDEPSAARQGTRAPRNIRMTTTTPSERPRSEARKASLVDHSNSLRAEKSKACRDVPSKLAESNTPIPAPNGVSSRQPISSGDHTLPHSPRKLRDDTTSPQMSPMHTAKRPLPKAEASHVEVWFIRGSERSHGSMPMSNIQAAIILYEMSRSRV
jgi:hypothetical protein